MHEPFIKVNDLYKNFELPHGHGKDQRLVRAVKGVSFGINPGETVGLVGESGCGKTVTGKMILKLLEPSSGDILIEGKSIVRMSQRKFRSMRKDIQIVFQDPNATLDPKMTIENILAEALLMHRITVRPHERQEVARLLGSVGLDNSAGRALPHELSSGQKQRVGIARAIATRPRFIMCDEPVSALDVSVQSQILNLLMQLKKDMGMTYLFVSHSLGVVHHVSDRVIVMYAGKIVEEGTNEDIFVNARHPYTKALLEASPVPDPEKAVAHNELKGEVPSAFEQIEGCQFHPRCPYATEKCRIEVPAPVRVSDSHMVVCHYQGS